MPKSSGSTCKTCSQPEATDTPNGEAGDALDFHTMLELRGSLQNYLTLLFYDDKSTLQPKEDISTYLKEVALQYTHGVTAERKIELLLDVARNSYIISQTYSDNLVKKAGELLPSVAYQLLATILVQEAQQAFHEPTSYVASEVGETLLTYLSPKDKERIMTRDEWKALLAECTEKERLSIMRHLIRIGRQQSTSLKAGVSIHPGLEFLLECRDGVDWLALLLQDETEQASDYTPLDEDAELDAYNTHLHHARSCTAHLLQSHGFHKVIHDNFPKLQTMEVLKAEMQRLKRTFPSSPSSAVFFVSDAEWAEVMRFVMSGPVGTPYSRGLFVFDIFCPPDYPSVPPRVKLMSTVNGADFFGSHVESNEVSLASVQKKLGYKNSGDWSITKVLHLLKNMMLPAMKETTQDGAKCTEGRPRRLCRIRAKTVRYAMLEPLKKPPVGLENVIRLYFTVQQEVLLKQCSRWVQESPDNKKLKLNVMDLYTCLQVLGGTALKENFAANAS